VAYLVDSSVLIAIERRGDDFDALAAALPRRQPMALASITAAELLAGVHHADSADRYLRRSAFVEMVIESVPVISYDLLAARVHADVGHELQRAGQRIGEHDLIIGATALAHGFRVLTENLRDFERISGLEVERPNWERNA
jgi:tRNA(fMet)-specific endonuclease VapC